MELDWINSFQQSLDFSPSAQEIKEALFSINLNKAPSSDGFHALFFQKFWHICGDKICFAIQNFSASGAIPPNWCDMTLIMISKLEHPEIIS